MHRAVLALFLIRSGRSATSDRRDRASRTFPTRFTPPSSRLERSSCWSGIRADLWRWWPRSWTSAPRTTHRDRRVSPIWWSTWRSAPRTDGKRPHTDLLEIAGAGAWNAFTTHDVTTYYSAGAAAGIPHLLGIQTTRLLDPRRGIDAQTFDVEREVVRAELRQRNERGEIAAVDTALAAALYPKGHPYSRPIIGTESSLSALTLEHARAFAATHYRPEKMTLLVAGDVDPGGASALLQGSVAAPFLAGRRARPDPGGSPAWDRSDLPRRFRTGRCSGGIKAAAPVPTLHIAWSLPRGFDKDGHLQTFAFRLVARALLHAFKDEQLLDIGGSLERGKLGGHLVYQRGPRRGQVAGEGAGPAPRSRWSRSGCRPTPTPLPIRATPGPSRCAFGSGLEDHRRVRRSPRRACSTGTCNARRFRISPETRPI